MKQRHAMSAKGHRHQPRPVTPMIHSALDCVSRPVRLGGNVTLRNETNMIRCLLPVALAATVVAIPAAAQTAPPMPVGNAAAGAKVFVQCKTCHVTDKGVNRIGPSLAGVVGRKSGTVPGYKYSAANLKSGVVWTAPTLYKYLEAPMKFMPGTKMTFGGLKKPQDRADVIAFLKTKP